MTNEEESQRKYLEYQFLMQHTQQLGQQIQQIRSHLTELESLNENISEMGNTKENDEILIPLGSGIFTKGKLSKDKNVIMNVGSDVLVTKSIPDAKKLIEEQADELKKFVVDLENQLSLLTSNMRIMEENITDSN